MHVEVGVEEEGELDEKFDPIVQECLGIATNINVFQPKWRKKKLIIC
jgi:hypothetical protein